MTAPSRLLPRSVLAATTRGRSLLRKGRSFHENRGAIAPFIRGPGRTGNVRLLGHAMGHLLGDVDVGLVAVLFHGVGHVRAESLQEHGNAILPTDLLGALRCAVEPASLVERRVFIDLVERRGVEQFLIERLLEGFRIVLGDISHLSRFGDQALGFRCLDRLEKFVEDIGDGLRLDPVDVVEVNSHDGARGCRLVALADERDQIADDDLPCRGIIEIDRAFLVAPAIAGLVGGGKAIAIVADVAVSPDVIEDEVDPRLHPRNGMLSVDIEPADCPPRDRRIQALQYVVIDGAREARRPILVPLRRLRVCAG